MCHIPARPERPPSSTNDIDITMQQARALLEQQRAQLVLALSAAEKSVKALLPGSLAQNKARARVTRLQDALRLLNGQLSRARRHRNLGDFLIQICRERATRHEWRCIVAEAQRRHEAQTPQAL
jgi:hypothetical protein